MSDPASSRRADDKVSRAQPIEPRYQPLPPPPRPIQKTRDPFEDYPEMRPRSGRTIARATTALPPSPSLLADDEEPIEPLPSARAALMTARADMHRVELLGGQAYRPRPTYTVPGPQHSIFGLFQAHPWLIVPVSVLCIAIILLASAPSRLVISGYSGVSSAKSQSSAPPAAPSGEHSLLGKPTISADVIDAVLAKYGSPAAGTGRTWIEMGERYGIDPAYALAFFIQESSAGTNPRWDGMKADGSTTHNIGNISCAGYPRCLGRWRDYGSWQEGIEDWYRLIADEYVRGRGVSTIEQIIPIYAPSFENDVNAYIQTVVTLVDKWRGQGVKR